MNKTTPTWEFRVDPPFTAQKNMAIDQAHLDDMNAGLLTNPIVRLFGWRDSAITYGYLLDPKKVNAWALSQHPIEIVRRPTGGGAVFHQPSDLSLSLLWPRNQGILPDKPSACYAEIHRIILGGLQDYFGNPNFELHGLQVGREGEGCGGEVTRGALERNPHTSRPRPTADRFSICFDEPVCNDVMLGGQKVVGGALRLTRKAILYQGNIVLQNMDPAQKLTAALIKTLQQRLK